jgi:hypothetical protein
MRTMSRRYAWPLGTALSCRDKGAPNWMYWEFEDGLANAIAGAAESAFGADLAACDQQIRSLSVMVMTPGS